MPESHRNRQSVFDMRNRMRIHGISNGGRSNTYLRIVDKFWPDDSTTVVVLNTGQAFIYSVKELSETELSAYRKADESVLT